MKKLKLGITPRIYKEGQAIFGKGAIYLLKGVQETGSLRSAAMAMEMSYKKAIAILKKAESGLGKPLVERTIGGKGGGGSHLTSFGEKFLEEFLIIEEEITQYSNKLFEEKMEKILSSVN